MLQRKKSKHTKYTWPSSTGQNLGIAELPDTPRTHQETQRRLACRHRAHQPGCLFKDKRSPTNSIKSIIHSYIYKTGWWARPFNCLNLIFPHWMGPGSEPSSVFRESSSNIACLCPKQHRNKINFNSQNVFCRSLLINRTPINCNEFQKGNSAVTDLQASRV